MASWIEDGCVVSAGSRRSRAASTARRSSSKKAGSMAADIGRGEGCAAVTIRSPVPDRTAQQRASHQLSSEEFPLGPRPLPVASGIRAKGPRPLQTISWRHREKVVDFPAAAPPLPGGPVIFRNQVSSVARTSLSEWNSRDRPHPQHEKYFQRLQITHSDRETSAPEARSILRHVTEPKQSLGAIGSPVPHISRQFTAQASTRGYAFAHSLPLYH